MHIRIVDGVYLTAHYLDEIIPGWEWMVDPHKLNLIDPRNCIVEQLKLDHKLYETENEHLEIGFCTTTWASKKKEYIHKMWMYEMYRRINKRTGYSKLFWWKMKRLGV